MSEFLTIRDIARETGLPENLVRKRLRKYMKYHGLSESRFLQPYKGSYRYVIPRWLWEDVQRYYEPKIRIEVRV